jgi:hypothetical protein
VVRARDHDVPRGCGTYVVPLVQLASQTAPWLFITGMMLELPSLAWVRVIGTLVNDVTMATIESPAVLVQPGVQSGVVAIRNDHHDHLGRHDRGNHEPRPPVADEGPQQELATEGHGAADRHGEQFEFHRGHHDRGACVAAGAYLRPRSWPNPSAGELLFGLWVNASFQVLPDPLVGACQRHRSLVVDADVAGIGVGVLQSLRGATEVAGAAVEVFAAQYITSDRRTFSGV